MQFTVYLCKTLHPISVHKNFHAASTKKSDDSFTFWVEKNVLSNFWVKKKVSNFWVKKRYSTFGVYPDFGFKKIIPTFGLKKMYPTFGLKRGR